MQNFSLLILLYLYSHTNTIFACTSKFVPQLTHETHFLLGLVFLWDRWHLSLHLISYYCTWSSSEVLWSGFMITISVQEGAFAQLKVWQSASIAVVFFLSSYISLKAMLVIMLAALCISYAGFLFLTLKVEKAFSSSSSWSRCCS